MSSDSQRPRRHSDNNWPVNPQPKNGLKVPLDYSLKFKSYQTSQNEKPIKNLFKTFSDWDEENPPQIQPLSIKKLNSYHSAGSRRSSKTISKNEQDSTAFDEKENKIHLKKSSAKTSPAIHA